MFYSAGSGAREVVAKPPGMKNLVKLVGADHAVSLWRDYYAAVTASAATGALVVDGESGGASAPSRQSWSSVAARFRKANWRGVAASSSVSAVSSTVASRVASVESLASGDASMQVVSSKVQAQRPGYCYLYAVSVDKMTEVAQLLGPEPEFRRLVALPVVYFESFAVLQSLAVEKFGTRLHVETVTRSGVTRFLTLCRSLRGEFPGDSLAASVLSNYSVCTAEFVNSERCTIGARADASGGYPVGGGQVVQTADVCFGSLAGAQAPAQLGVGSLSVLPSAAGVLADDGKYQLLCGRAASSVRCSGGFQSDVSARLLVVPREPARDAVASSLRGDQDVLNMKEFFLTAWRDPLVRSAARRAAAASSVLVGRSDGVVSLGGRQLEAGFGPSGFAYIFHLALHDSVAHMHVHVVGGMREPEGLMCGQSGALDSEARAEFHEGSGVPGFCSVSASVDSGFRFW